MPTHVSPLVYIDMLDDNEIIVYKNELLNRKIQLERELNNLNREIIMRKINEIDSILVYL